MMKRLLGLIGVTSDDPRPGDSRPRMPARQAGAVGVAPQARPFQAVAIVPGAQCCEAARREAGTRYLVRGAPRLPLPDCGAPQDCKCRFRKHDDRREDDRRSPYRGGLGMNIPSGERRRGRGRRSTDR